MAWHHGRPGAWRGRASRTDRALIVAMLVVVAIGLVLRPLQPFLIASHPVLLAFLSGDLFAIGAAAAFRQPITSCSARSMAGRDWRLGRLRQLLPILLPLALSRSWPCC